MNINFKKAIKNILKILYVFPVNKNQIFFMSFDGTNVGYDSRAIYEYILNNYPSKYKCYWGCNNKVKFKNSYSPIATVKIKSIQGVLKMMTSGTVIYNINAPMYIPFRRGQLLINTWHGYPFKKVGKDAHDHFNKEQVNATNVYTSHSKKFSELLRTSFEYEGVILESGAPRNDMLINGIDKIQSEKIRSTIGVDANKKIVLFAPTFRGDFLYTEFVIDEKKILQAVKEKFGGEWVFLVRLHPRVSQKLDIGSKDIIDVSSYPDMQDLLVVADVLITDYSGSIWDMCLTKKPIFRFANDIEKYVNDRGLYNYYYELPFDISYKTEELCASIINYDEYKYKKNVDEFLTNHGCFETGNCCRDIMRIIEGNK